MKKKVLPLLMSAVLVASSLMGCSKADNSSGTTANAATEAASGSSTAGTGASDSNTIKVGVLFSSSGSTSTLEDV